MGSPRTLKNLMLFNDGAAYIGDLKAFTPPKLARKFEEYRAGGMDRAVKVDMGGEPLESEFTCASVMRDVLRQSGVTTVGGVMLRAVGAIQNDETGGVDTVEIVLRGRHEEIDMGEWKPGEAADFKVKSALSYFKLDWNGVTDVEIDVLNMIEIVGGVDRLAAQREALGI